MNTPNTPEPQLVRWGPVDQKAPGILVEDSSGQQFIDWDDLKAEIETKLLPQVRRVPVDSSVGLDNLGDRKNWLVRISDNEGTGLGDMWFGTSPDDKWKWDGLVRLGDSEKQPGTDSPVWQTFQRYSDGSYRRIEAKVVT